MIPEAAVEAAVSAHCEGTMRDALEAAAPHMLAAEYDRGFSEGFDEGHRAGQESMETE